MFENKKIQNLFLNEEKVEDLIQRYYSDIYKYCFFHLGTDFFKIDLHIKCYIYLSWFDRNLTLDSLFGFVWKYFDKNEIECNILNKHKNIDKIGNKIYN